ncbi:MAG: nucleotidyltransferase family protein [Candidatus Latescibacterota bacterium]
MPASAAVQGKQQVFERLRLHEEQLRELGVRRLGLFGSFVRHQQRQGSDVDLLVEFEPGRKRFDSFMHVAFLLEDVLGRRVELLTPESLSPYLGPHILAEAEYVAFDD